MNEVPDFVIFLGRFHPLLVHLPIGFLLFAFLLEIYQRIKKINDFNKAISAALLLGGAGAIAASVLGYMLSQSGGYNQDMLDQHFWFAIVTIVISLLAWALKENYLKLKLDQNSKIHLYLSVVIVILISVTGHLGGNLTHGSEYLMEYAPFGRPEKIVLEPVLDVQEATLYGHLVAPILKEKCLSCHNESKLKGQLSLQDSVSMFKGGKHGNSLVIGDADASEIYKRVMLDLHDKKFMPPEGKPGLTENEKEILAYWINTGKADFSKKIKEVETTEEILKVASALLGLDEKSAAAKLATVSQISEDVLNELAKEGFVLRELVFGSSLYDVVLPENSSATTEEMASKFEVLAKVGSNVLWLSVRNNHVSDALLSEIALFENLQKLHLNKNPITDIGIQNLSSIPSLKSLNIYETEVTEHSFETLNSIKSLKNVYLWKTGITDIQIKEFEKNESHLNLILGI